MCDLTGQHTYRHRRHKTARKILEIIKTGWVPRGPPPPSAHQRVSVLIMPSLVREAPPDRRDACRQLNASFHKSPRESEGKRNRRCQPDRQVSSTAVPPSTRATSPARRGRAGPIDGRSLSVSHPSGPSRTMRTPFGMEGRH